MNLTMEEYRSGHNEAVLKTVWEKSHKGSNPFSSAKKTDLFRQVGFLTKSTLAGG